MSRQVNWQTAKVHQETVNYFQLWFTIYMLRTGNDRK